MLDEYKIKGYEIIRKEVKQSGSSGMVYLPKSWIGEQVAVVRKGRFLGSGNRGAKFEIWTADPSWEKICDCSDEYDALSRRDLLQQLDPEKEFIIQEFSVSLHPDD